jgi:hypothetical protein
LLDDGLLFELNRTVLHQYGLALALVFDDEDLDGEPTGVSLLQTDDREGITFTSEAFLDGERKIRAFLEREGNSRLSARRMLLGFTEQCSPDQVESERPNSDD